MSLLLSRAGLSVLALLLLAPASFPQFDAKRERGRMKAMLDAVCDEVEKNFYDEKLRGLDWKALKEEANKNIDAANTAGAMITAIFSLVNRLDDSHTVFLPPARVDKLKFGFEAKAFGDEVRVYEVKEKSAAAKAGLQVGDRLLKVEGWDVERSTFDLMIVYLRALRPRSPWKITYSRAGQAPQEMLLEAQVERGQVVEDLTRIDTIYQYIREAENEKEKYTYNTYDGGIGYVHLPSFSAGDEFMDRLMGRIKDSKAVIVDLRGNPGGSVEVLGKVAGYFEPEEVTMANMVKRQKSEPVKARPRRPRLTGPMFVLVDSQSASASEMFARHFQSTGRAKVIGDDTAGRVTASRFFSRQIGVDVVVPFGVQVAVGRVVFPDGSELEKRGVKPDTRCVPTGEQLSGKSDVCLAVAVWQARKALGLPEPVAEPTQKQ